MWVANPLFVITFFEHKTLKTAIFATFSQKVVQQFFDAIAGRSMGAVVEFFVTGL